MAKKIALLVVVLLWAPIIQSFVSENAKVEGKASKHEAKENMQDAQEKAESWIHWAQFKQLSQLGLNKENVREVIGNIVNRAGDAASKTTQKMKSAVSGLSKYVSQKEGTPGHERDSVSVLSVYEETKSRLKMVLKLGSDAARDAYQVARQRLNREADVASDKAGDVKNLISKNNGHTNGPAAEAYDEAVHNVQERYKSAKETKTDQAKAEYEAAKEKASDAAGNLGNEMRDRTAEL